jgi:hypothetical protein
MPSTAATLVVPVNAAPAGFAYSASVTVLVAPAMRAPEAPRTSTCTAGAIMESRNARLGWTVNPICVGVGGGGGGLDGCRPRTRYLVQ